MEEGANSAGAVTIEAVAPFWFDAYRQAWALSYRGELPKCKSSSSGSFPEGRNISLEPHFCNTCIKQSPTQGSHV